MFSPTSECTQLSSCYLSSREHANSLDVLLRACSKMPFQPIPGSKPLTISAALAPPVVYCAYHGAPFLAYLLPVLMRILLCLYHLSIPLVLALVLLPPCNDASPQTRKAISVVRNTLAITASILFARLPLCYHVPWSAGLTYILSLTGWYGASRVIDLFFISGRHTIPRRVKRKLREVDDTDTESEAEAPEPPAALRESPERLNGTGKSPPALL